MTTRNQQSKKFRVRLALAAILILVGWFTSIARADTPPDSEPVIKLTNGWQYRWGESPLNAAGKSEWLLDPPDSPDWQPVEDLSRLSKHQEERILWLRIPLPAGKWRDPTIFFDSVDQGLEAYLDQALIYQAGQVDRPENEPALGTTHHMIRLPAGYGGKMLTLRIYSAYNTIGPRVGVFLGEHADHIVTILHTNIDRFTLGFFFIIIGLAAASFYVRRPEQRAYLALGLFSVSAGVFVVFRTQLIELFFTSSFLQEYSKLTAIFLMPVGLAAFFEEVVSRGPGLIIRRMWQVHLAYVGLALGASLLGLVQPLNTVLPFEVLASVTLVSLVVISTRESLRGNIDAQLFTVGYSLVLLFALIELLDDIGVIDLAGRVLHWGVLGFIIVLIFILLRRFSQAVEDRTRLLAIQQELSIAHRIQQNLLPPERPAWASPEVVCFSTPAEEMGGDLYAYHAFENGHYALMVGDVSGKGMAAALLMAVSLVSVQAVMDRALPPAELLTYLDRIIQPYTRTTHQNCAFCYVELSQNSSHSRGDATVRVANAGCVYPIIRRANGEVEWLEVGGIPLGLRADVDFEYQELATRLRPGDMLILTSDGVVEAHDERQQLFGFERLEQTIAAGPPTSAEALLAHVRNAIDRFVGSTEVHDDMTVVVVQL